MSLVAIISHEIVVKLQANPLRIDQDILRVVCIFNHNIRLLPLVSIVMHCHWEQIHFINDFTSVVTHCNCQSTCHY